MGLPTVSRFCFCCDLSTGNKVCCWLMLMIYIVITAIALLSLIFGVDIIQIRKVNLTGYEVFGSKRNSSNETFMREEIEEITAEKFGIADSLGTIIIAAILAFVCYYFLQGIKYHDTGKMMPYIIQNGVFGILFLGAALYFMNLYFAIKAIIVIYITICAYSLYQVFAYEDSQRQENLQMNANYEQGFGVGVEADKVQQYQGP